VTVLNLNRRQYLELEKIALGAFAPLSGFMMEDEFLSVVETMRLPNGDPFPLPVVLDLAQAQADRIRCGSRVTLVFQDREVGALDAESLYKCDKMDVSRKVFGTDEVAHPGVGHFMRMGDVFLGGAVQLFERAQLEFSEFELTPSETRANFESRGLRTVAGFQTRNVPHRAHEYLQRLALEHCDGLFIQPLVGAKKRGDYQPGVILAAYHAMIAEFLPQDRVVLGILSTAMRYAGPREAIFHAIIRRNYGCTHFVVGRDHAGVGNYYGKYEAHELTRQFDGQLGIEILRFHGPFHCRTCGGIVTERSCPHVETDPPAITEISGSDIRDMLSNGAEIRPELLRPEVAESIKGLPLFIEGDAE
jgi:sulfate adenylyltransferase